MDHVTRAQRSAIMAKVQNKNTLPEIKVRKALHKMGARYSLHQKNLPGCPDIVMRAKRKVIFVHGCFWHRHSCSKATMPKSNVEFWQEKFRRNVARDKLNIDRLAELGWTVEIVWQCETQCSALLHSKLECILCDASN